MKGISIVFSVIGKIWCFLWFLVLIASLIGNFISGGMKEVYWALSPLNFANYFVMVATIAPAGLFFKVSEFYEKKYHESILKDLTQLNPFESKTAKQTIVETKPVPSIGSKFFVIEKINTPPIISEQNMRPGNIIFVSSSQFSGYLKMIPTKLEPDDEINNLNSSSKYSYIYKKEILIETGNIDLMAHDLDEILHKYKHLSLSNCYTLGKEDLKCLLNTRQILFQDFT
jgi:hypothetical protein